MIVVFMITFWPRGLGDYNIFHWKLQQLSFCKFSVFINTFVVLQTRFRTFVFIENEYFRFLSNCWQPKFPPFRVEIQCFAKMPIIIFARSIIIEKYNNRRFCDRVRKSGPKPIIILFKSIIIVKYNNRGGGTYTTCADLYFI